MAFDYKKEFKELYLPKKQPEIIKVPKINYIAVSGTAIKKVELIKKL